MSSLARSSRRSLSTSARRQSVKPLLPNGRLPAESLRQLVDLHHSAANFITPSSLSQVVASVFSQTVTRTASDEALRDAAARQLERGGIPGQKSDTLVELASNRKGQSLKGIRQITDGTLLGYASTSAPHRSPTAVSMYRQVYGASSLSWSDETIGESINPAGTYGSSPSSSNPPPRRLSSRGRSTGLLNYDMANMSDDLVALREARRDDALYGTVGGGRPGLEAVLDHMSENKEEQGEVKEGSEESARENNGTEV
jgi:hypothetical protein